MVSKVKRAPSCPRHEAKAKKPQELVVLTGFPRKENLHVSCLQSHHSSGSGHGIVGSLSPEEISLLTVPSSNFPDPMKKTKDSNTALWGQRQHCRPIRYIDEGKVSVLLVGSRKGYSSYCGTLDAANKIGTT